MKVIEKEKIELTLQKWKEEDNGGLRKKILQCVLDGGPYSNHIPYEGHTTLWQKKVNQKIAKARLIAKRNRKQSGVPIPSFLPILELPWFHGYKAPSLSPIPQQQLRFICH